MSITVRQGTKDNPEKKRYYTLEATTREDVKRLRGSEIMKRVRNQGIDSIEKQMTEQRQGEDVRYPNGMKLRLPITQAEGAYHFMKTRVPGGPPAVRATFNLGAHFETQPDGTKILVRDD